MFHSNPSYLKLSVTPTKMREGKRNQRKKQILSKGCKKRNKHRTQRNPDLMKPDFSLVDNKASTEPS